MKKFILIGKQSLFTEVGPSRIVYEIDKKMRELNENFESLLLSKSESRIAYLRKIASCILCSSGNIVNVHTDSYLIPLFVLFCSKINRKNSYYLTVHGIYAVAAEYTKNSKNIYKIIEKILFKHFPKIVCVSEMLKNSLSEIFGRKENVYVIPNATSATEFRVEKKFSRDDQYINLLMLGGIRKIKGIHESLQLVDYLVHQKGMKINYEIYGYADDEEMATFSQKLKECVLENIVHYCGVLNDKETVYAIISQADFQLCLSHYDTFNVAIAESLALGCPCICSDKCGAAYLVHQGENGLVVNLEDKDMLEKVSRYMMTLVDNPEKYQKISESRAEYKEILSWNAVCQKYIELT